ncbi:MAG: 4-hydroxy-tetrahydrodipicolinate synthase [Clostridia bacterium]|nr:4-hydroxy-tetrahydrodipicolinate synthase [Clostridia bacterium]MBR5044724.1 4-hydroxy-tetrahydrodipicolinate synthase [Clostridia bacterium]
MKKPIFTGICTALVTPFSDGKVDYETFRFLIDLQLDSGIDAICVAGTTGEAATLSDLEWEKLLAVAVEGVDGKIPVIAGVGSNATARSATLARRALSGGADAVLAVTPYYNRGTAEGIVRHYHWIADAELPVIVYNVPGRTGVDLSVDLYRRISEHPGIAGVKEAGEGYDRLLDFFDAFGDRLPLYTGCDAAILPAVALGASGAVSVISNLIPRETRELYLAAARGDLGSARRMTALRLPLIRALFSETNPAPIKRAMELAGLCRGELRLPLAPVGRELSDRLADLLGMN